MSVIVAETQVIVGVKCAWNEGPFPGILALGFPVQIEDHTCGGNLSNILSHSFVHKRF